MMRISPDFAASVHFKCFVATENTAVEITNDLFTQYNLVSEKIEFFG